MNWINLNIQTLDSENFLGSEPVDRATWLCLLRYCVGQENGGIMTDCLAWGDRKWQQLVRVTKKEATRQCDLWSFDGNNLIVWGYPAEKQTEVQHLRAIGKLTTPAKQAAAKANGSKGGRPTNNPTGNPTQNPTETEQETHAKPIELERKGKEGELEVISLNARAHEIPSVAQVKAYAASSPTPISEICAIAFHDTQEAAGWITKHGHSIADWRAALRRYASLWNENEKSHRLNGTKPDHRQQRAANEYPEPKIQPRRL